MARLKSKKTLEYILFKTFCCLFKIFLKIFLFLFLKSELAKYSGIPVLNGLDDFGHPC